MASCSSVSLLQHFIKKPCCWLSVLFRFHAVLVVMDVEALRNCVPLILTIRILFLGEYWPAAMFVQNSFAGSYYLIKIKWLGNDRVVMPGNLPRKLPYVLRAFGLTTDIHFDMIVLLGLVIGVRRIDLKIHAKFNWLNQKRNKFYNYIKSC